MLIRFTKRILRLFASKSAWKRIIIGLVGLILVLAPAHITLSISTGEKLAAIKEHYREEGRMMTIEDLRTHWTNGGPPAGYDESRARDHTGRSAAEYLAGPLTDIGEERPLWMGWQEYFKEELHPFTTNGNHLFHRCTDEQEAELRAILQENAALLESLHTVSRLAPSRPEWIYDALGIEEKGIQSAQIPNLLATRSFANLMTIEALLAHRDGDHDEALRICGDIVRFSNHLRDFPVLINQMIGVAIAYIALEFLIPLVEYGEFSSDTLYEFESLLERSDYRKALASAYEVERLFVMGVIEQDWVGRQWLSERPNETISDQFLGTVFINIYFGPLCRPLRNNDGYTALEIFRVQHQFMQRPSYDSAELGAILRRKYQALRPGPFRPFLHPFSTIFLSDLGRSHRALDELEVGLAGARLILALRHFKQLNGQYPGSLSALETTSLSVVPVDPLNGQAPQYSRMQNGFELLFSLPKYDDFDPNDGYRRNRHFYISLDR